MTFARVREREATLTLRGFNYAPMEVETIVGIQASDRGRAEEVRDGTKTPLRRSFVVYSVQFPDGCRLDEMLPALIARLGGISHLERVKRLVAPEFMEFDIVLPIKGSPEQEGGFLTSETLAEIGGLGATLAFSFL